MILFIRSIFTWNVKTRRRIKSIDQSFLPLMHKNEQFF
jgi:hypothetical protein